MPLAISFIVSLLFSDIKLCVQKGSSDDLSDLLQKWPTQIDHDILQLACNLNFADHLRILVEHNIRLGTTDIEANLQIKSEETYDVLFGYDKLKNKIDVDWNDIHTTLGSNEKGLQRFKALIQKFCRQSADKKERKRCVHIQQSLKQYLFECICKSNPEAAWCIVRSVEGLLNETNINGETPIVYAAAAKEEDIVEMLAKEQPDISVVSNDDKQLIDYLPQLAKKDLIANILSEVRCN